MPSTSRQEVPSRLDALHCSTRLRVAAAAVAPGERPSPRFHQEMVGQRHLASLAYFMTEVNRNRLGHCSASRRAAGAARRPYQERPIRSGRRLSLGARVERAMRLTAGARSRTARRAPAFRVTSPDVLRRHAEHGHGRQRLAGGARSARTPRVRGGQRPAATRRWLSAAQRPQSIRDCGRTEIEIN